MPWCTRYDAFAGRRIVVLGSGELGAAHGADGARARARGRRAGRGAATRRRRPPTLVARARGARACRSSPATRRCAPRAAATASSGLVRRRPRTAREVSIACDTVCLAIGLAPGDRAAGCGRRPAASRRRRGGHAPALRRRATSCRRLRRRRRRRPDRATPPMAAEQGRQAARQALGVAAPRSAAYRAPTPAPIRRAWMRALTRDAMPR